MNKVERRDDILVSVCFASPNDLPNTKACISRLTKILERHFRYWELIVICKSQDMQEFEKTLLKFKNLRLISVISGLDVMQHRVIAAEQAIGDVVVLTTTQEAEQLDIANMISDAHSSNAAVVGERAPAFLAEPFVLALGKASGFLASTRDMQTVSIPRNILNKILRYPNPELSLRFMPSDKTIRVLRSQIFPSALGGQSKISNPVSNWRTRVELLTRMGMEAAPALLLFVGLFSGVAFFGAIFFIIYVVVVYFTQSDITAGWTTLSLAISGSICFISCTLFAVCIALRKLLEIINSEKADFVVAEKSSVDLFENVRNELNVDPGQSD